MCFLKCGNMFLMCWLKWVCILKLICECWVFRCSIRGVLVDIGGNGVGGGIVV